MAKINTRKTERLRQATSTPLTKKQPPAFSATPLLLPDHIPRRYVTTDEANKSNTQSEKTAHRRKKRYRSGTVALREIKRYQKDGNLLIPKAAFSRVVKEVFMDLKASHYRVQTKAMEALQEAAEFFLVVLLGDANLCSIHAKRVTLKREDLSLVRRLSKNFI